MGPEKRQTKLPPPPSVRLSRSLELAFSPRPVGRHKTTPFMRSLTKHPDGVALPRSSRPEFQAGRDRLGG